MFRSYILHVLNQRGANLKVHASYQEIIDAHRAVFGERP